MKLNLYARESATPKLHKSLQTSVREETERNMMGGRGEAGLRVIERERGLRETERLEREYLV